MSLLALQPNYSTTKRTHRLGRLRLTQGPLHANFKACSYAVIRALKTVILLSLTLGSLSTNSLASDDIMIVRVSDYQQDHQLLLDSESHFHLSEELISALHHEVPLNFKTEIRLVEETKWLGFTFKRTRQSIEYHTQLNAYGFNQRYVLYNNRNRKVQTFQTLESALQTLGTLQAFPVIPLSELHPDQSYRLKMKISLDPWKLPAPLVIESLYNSEWRLSSDWFEVTIHTPKSWL